MEVLFTENFQKSLKKYQSLKKIIQKKVDLIIENPVQLGEPLKGNFRGYYTAPVKKNFLIIFLYCRICRRKKEDGIVLCHDCKDYPDDTIRFIDFGPHDQIYKR
jgi:mRNA-degrading endonuclease YafQ of YafQ-DinJ toxin-antitoxin module